MTSSVSHIAFETLNDYADGLLGAGGRKDVERHIANCTACAALLDDLRRVVATAAAAPRSILPPEDGWPELRRELERRKEVVLPTAFAAGRAAAPPRPSWRRWGALAAAGIALVVMSSAITRVVVRQSLENDLAGVQETQPGEPERIPSRPMALPASFRVTEDEYLRTIGELREAVESQRHALSPKTVATVERSLRVVDEAIAEARDALVRDPRNEALVDLLSASYQRKLELLRRASELSVRS